jgi:hypothetical protein
VYLTKFQNISYLAFQIKVPSPSSLYNSCNYCTLDTEPVTPSSSGVNSSANGFWSSGLHSVDGGTSSGIVWSVGCLCWKVREKWSKSPSDGILQNVGSASVTSLMARAREWRYNFWTREAAAASYCFCCLCCFRCRWWNCCGRRGGGSPHVSVWGASDLWWVVLSFTINSVHVSSSCTLSAMLLKRWIHFFCQSLCECSPSVGSSEPSSLFVESALLIWGSISGTTDCGLFVTASDANCVIVWDLKSPGFTNCVAGSLSKACILLAWSL